MKYPLLSDLEEKLEYLDEALATCSRPRARKVLKKERQEVFDEIQARKLSHLKRAA